MEISVRLGKIDDADAALSIYERSNLARRHGQWPSRTSRLAQVSANIRDDASWFLVAHDDNEAVAMALVLPFRTERGAGRIVPKTSFLDLIYVLPERWGEGIGGMVLDAVIDEAGRRGSPRIYLWTHEHDNERAHRLYLGRGFRRTSVTGQDDAGGPVAEWVRDG